MDPPTRDEGWSLLERRIQSLESTFIGEPVSQLPAAQLAAPSISSHLEDLSASLEDVDKKVPDLQACLDLLTNQFPSLLQKRSSVKQMMERADEVAAARDALLENVHALEQIQELKVHVNGFDIDSIEQLRRRLAELDAQYADLQQQLAAQTNEIDEILDIYEKSMLLMSKTCATWEWRLQDCAK